MARVTPRDPAGGRPFQHFMGDKRPGLAPSHEVVSAGRSGRRSSWDRLPACTFGRQISSAGTGTCLVAEDGIVGEPSGDQCALGRRGDFIRDARLLGPAVLQHRRADSWPALRTNRRAAASSIRLCTSSVFSMVSSRSARRPARSPDQSRASRNRRMASAVTP